MSEIFERGLLDFGVSCTGEMRERFNIYAEYLLERNGVMNLTAVRDIGEIETRHFLECAALCKYFDFAGKSIIDIGSGAGFPGLPLKIISNDLKLTLIDSQKKRISFLEEVCEKLGFPGVSCIYARAEEQALLNGFRDSYDFAVSRAVARLNILCELCMPFIRPDGVFIAMKTNHCDDEITESKQAVKVLGGYIENIFDYGVPGTDTVRRLIVIRKTAKTPSGYPRRFAKIQKENIR